MLDSIGCEELLQSDNSSDSLVCLEECPSLPVDEEDDDLIFMVQCQSRMLKYSIALGEDKVDILHELDRLMALPNGEQAARDGLADASPQAIAEEPARPISPIPRVESRMPPFSCTHRRSSQSARPGVPSVGELIEASQGGPTEPPAGAEPEWRTAEDKLEEAVPVVSEGELPVAARAPLLEPDVDAVAQPL
ncbi:uncharacterized protein LOC125942445 isoform X2 [Dermacentor silvarum]|nr:uncharacterized protein LOC125942445 isoform X2 [Dermacentor silvarum]